MSRTEEVAKPTPQQQAVPTLMGEVAQTATTDGQVEIELKLLTDLVNGFSSNPALARRAMRDLLGRSPGRFYSAALQVLKAQQSGPGQDHLQGLLLENNLVLQALGDPEALTLPTAVALAKALMRKDTQLDARLLRQVTADDTWTEVQLASLERILAIVDGVSTCTRLVSLLMKLLRHKEKRVRSKAALLLVRAHKNVDWLKSQMANQDPRLRSNALEGLLSTVANEKQLEIVWGAAADGHHRVASTALLVLYRNGQKEAGEQLIEMSKHPEIMFQTAAIWAMGETGDPSFLSSLQGIVRNSAGRAKSMALKYSVQLLKIQRDAALAAAEEEKRDAG